MGQETEIAWTGTPRADGTIAPGATFNGWIGCDKVSAGCKNCYAEVDTPTRVHRHKGLELWGAKAARYRTSPENWKKPRRWNRDAVAAGVRRRVFAQSLSDTFEDRRDLDPWRADLFSLIEATPALDWLLLTKRPENMTRLAPASWAKAWPRNVWAGCTVEDQQRADERIPHLLRVPAAVRFLSVEPMLAEVDLDMGRCDTHDRDEVAVDPECGEFCNECAASGYSGELSYGHWLDACADEDQPGINWVIVGGESGPGARPFDLRWARGIADQCAAAGVPYFFKQAGAHLVDGERRVRLDDRKGGDIGELTAAAPHLWAAGVLRREWPAVRS